jgi:probable F420-dependent oxidoreductase
MKFWLCISGEPAHQLVEIARTAETAGFEGLAVCEHVVFPLNATTAHPNGPDVDYMTAHVPWPDPMTSIAAMATATSRLRFTTYVYVLPQRDPFTVAKQAATVAILSDYRFSLGVGVGWFLEEIQVLGHDPRTRGRRTDEMLAIIEDLWDDGYCEFSGEFFEVPRSAMFPVPEVPIPIWVGGGAAGQSDTASLRRAARYDGWLGMDYPFDEVPGLIERIGAARSDAGRTDNDFEVMLSPREPPALDVYKHLEDLGVTSAIGLAWWPLDPAVATIEAKRDALNRFADDFIHA